MKKEQVGLLVMAYGTPYQPEDIKRYYTHIRKGKEPSEEALQDLTEKYEAIGGVSPMAKITNDQAQRLAEYLNNMQTDVEFNVYIGLRHIEPFIEDAVEDMANDGIKRAVSIVLAPHYSSYSIKVYNQRAKRIADQRGISLTSVDKWHDHPTFIQYWTTAIGKIYHNMSEQERESTMLIVSAHSLPKKVIERSGDPYIEQLSETADLIAKQLNVKNYIIAWQSEGNTPDPWLGPDVLDITKDLYQQHGYQAFIYAPVGFVSDHLEVLYDNDIECKEVCDALGVSYYRPEMPNTNPVFIQAMAEVVMQQMQTQ